MDKKISEKVEKKTPLTFHLNDEMKELFFTLKGKLTEKLGRSVSNSDVIRLLLEEAKKMIEKIREN